MLGSAHTSSNNDGIKGLAEMVKQAALGAVNPYVGFVVEDVLNFRVDGLPQPPETVRESTKIVADTALMFLGANEIPGVKGKPANVRAAFKEAFPNPQTLGIVDPGSGVFSKFKDWLLDRLLGKKARVAVSYEAPAYRDLNPPSIPFNEGRTLREALDPPTWNVSLAALRIKNAFDWTVKRFEKLLGSPVFENGDGKIVTRRLDLSGVEATAGPVEFGIKGVWGGEIPVADVVAGDGRLVKGPMVVIKGDSGISRSPVSVAYDPKNKIVTVTNHSSQPINVRYGRNEILSEKLQPSSETKEVFVDADRPTVTIEQISGKPGGKTYKLQVAITGEAAEAAQAPKIPAVAVPEVRTPQVAETRNIGVPRQEPPVVRPSKPDLDIIPENTPNIADKIGTTFAPRGLKTTRSVYGNTTEFSVSPASPNRAGKMTVRVPTGTPSDQVEMIFDTLKGEGGGVIVDPFVSVKNGRPTMPTADITIIFRSPEEFTRMCDDLNNIRAGGLSPTARNRGLVSLDSGVRTYCEDNPARMANGISGKLFETDFVDQGNNPLPKVVIDMPMSSDMGSVRERLLKNLEAASDSVAQDLKSANDQNLHWKVISIFGVRR